MRRAESRPVRGAGLALLTVLALPAATLAAQDDSQAEAPSAEAAPESARALRRILHLAGGTTLRAVTRLEADAWSYKSGGGWKSIPAAGVRRVVLEKDALAEMRRLKKDLGRRDFAKRASFAGWMFSQGLLEEGMAELERVFTADPDHAGARAVLTRNVYRFRVPDVHVAPTATAREFDAGLAPILRFATTSAHTGRELAIHSLARIADQRALQSALLRALHASSVERRSFAALALRRLHPGEEVRALLARAVLDSSAKVRLNAALALRDVGEPALVVPVVRAMETSTSGRVRLQAEEALGNMGYMAAVGPLISRLSVLQRAGGSGVPHSNIFIGRQLAYIQDFDVEVAQLQAVADPVINVLIEGQVTDAGVQSIAHVFFVSERRAVRSSLQRITGENPGGRVRDWVGWWEQYERDSASGAGEGSRRPR
ncbi:MAG: HEAT repeat domain-containing protein [Planctomycetota bacterium]|nr:MAG: HEAT repeat domain-containing protein [Planctomycetota bacterium]